MLDITYVLGTVAFFGLMRAYVAFCERLGTPAEASEKKTETRP